MNSGAIALALVSARMVCAALAEFQGHAKAGRQSEAGNALDIAIGLAGESLAVIDEAVAETQAPDAFDRTQSTLAAFFVGKPGPDPDGVNDHLAAPSEPAPSIA